MSRLKKLAAASQRKTAIHSKIAKRKIQIDSYVKKLKLRVYYLYAGAFGLHILMGSIWQPFDLDRILYAPFILAIFLVLIHVIYWLKGASVMPTLPEDGDNDYFDF